MRRDLIHKGVQALRSYGYPKVTLENILTDKIYSAFFLQILKDIQDIMPHPDIAKLIDELENKEANHEHRRNIRQH